MKIPGDGSFPTRVLILGEAPCEADFYAHTPFAGSIGAELNRLLQSAGIMRSDCYTTYVCKVRPPAQQISNLIATKKKDITPMHVLLKGQYVLPEVVQGYTELLKEIELVRPNIIIALGNLSLWALTGKWSVAKWRGSLLKMDKNFVDQLDSDCPKVIPTYAISTVFKQFELRGVIINDFRRAKRHMTSRVYDNQPNWKFNIRPSFDLVQKTLAGLLGDCKAFTNPVWIDFDIETQYPLTSHIECIGLSWSRTEAMCIPFSVYGSHDPQWSCAEEAAIVYSLYKLLTHRNVRVRWQNGLFDAQHIYRYWHFIPRHGQDTMITQHSCFSAMPKALDFLASMYADWYRYWKDEHTGGSEEQSWFYNAQDCVYTREVGEVLQQTAQSLGVATVDHWQQRLFSPVLSAMIRGVHIRPEIRSQMALDIQEAISDREAFLYKLLGHPISIGSPKQMQQLFYEDLRQPPILKRVVAGGFTTMRPTCDDEALAQIAVREPILKPICNAIADLRTLEKFLGDFVMMKLDDDLRMRCSFNIAGDAGGKSAPYSYRLSSSKNAFGSGGNLQTIPGEKSKSVGKFESRGSMDFHLPNIRSMYGPDAGFTFFDMDLDRADLQVVVWESEDVMLKAALRLGADIHLLNTYGIDNAEPPPLEELVETHPAYADHKGPRKYKREFAKVFCHATNYLGRAKTVAAHTGRLVHEIDSAQKRWFAAHPGILAWHQRIITQVQKHKFVENKFGYRWYIMDRIDEMLYPAAVAWIPQSTVGIVINRAWINFHEQIPEVQVLLQVHDSLAGQFPTHRTATLLPLMQQHSRIVIPYDDPLVIPTGIKTSTVSWGDCK